MDAFTEYIENLCECTRCGKLCKVAGPPNPEARLMPYATAEEAKKRGLCADCAATVFIQGVETLMYGIKLNGVKILLDPHVQKGFGEVMVIGKADARPAEVNWQRVVDNWELPLPKRRKQSRRK